MFNKIFKFLISLFIRFPENPLKKVAREIFYGEVVTERIIEYPLVFTFLKYRGKKENRKVLDIGCYYSNLPIQLASMGFKVTGVDLQDYQLTHPNFVFKKGDIRKISFAGKFDIVTAISTIEHIGLGFYQEKEGLEGDLEAASAIKRHLKPGGLFIISLPFGRKSKTESYRNYDWKSVFSLLGDFRIQESIFFGEKAGKWSPIELSLAQKINNKSKVRGMGFFVAKRK